MKKLTLLVVTLLLLFGCKTTTQVNADATVVLHDEAFPTFSDYPIETIEEIFYLDDSAKEFVRQTVNPLDDDIDQMETLVRRIFDRSDLNLLYMGSANTTAMKTFESRAANCLSLTIMTYALAREAGFSVRFQDIQIPEYWTRREGYSLLNGHINLQLYPRDTAFKIYMVSGGYEVDFDPQSARRHFDKVIVDEKRIVAMFYNNKGADALLAGNFDKAYAYFRAAGLLDPNFDASFVNLGILYRMSENYQESHQAYTYALELDPDNLTAWENLAFLYQSTGNQEEADTIMARVDAHRKNNPYYHFILGEQELEAGHIEEALKHYREALKLDKSKHEIYFGLAKAYYELGDISRSQRYFSMAKSRSRNQQDQMRYQGKLDLLTRRNN